MLSLYGVRLVYPTKVGHHPQRTFTTVDGHHPQRTFTSVDGHFPLWVVTIFFLGSLFSLSCVVPLWSQACLPHKGWSPPTEDIHYQQKVVTKFKNLNKKFRSDLKLKLSFFFRYLGLKIMEELYLVHFCNLHE